jgi:hypothetical protein
MAMACRHAPVHALHRPRTLGTHAEIGNFVQYKSISSGGPPYGTLLQNLEVWCKNPSPAGPLNKPPFCISLQIPPLSLHPWRPSISPSKRGSTIFFCFLLSPHPLSSRNPTGASPPAAAARTAAHLAVRCRSARGS